MDYIFQCHKMFPARQYTETIAASPLVTDKIIINLWALLLDSEINAKIVGSCFIETEEYGD